MYINQRSHEYYEGHEHLWSERISLSASIHTNTCLVASRFPMESPVDSPGISNALPMASQWIPAGSPMGSPVA